MSRCNENILTKILRKYRWNAVIQPRQGIAPLMIATKVQGELETRGELEQLFSHSASKYPEPFKNQKQADIVKEIKAKRSSKISIHAGLDMLSNIFSGFGTKVKRSELEMAFEGAQNIVFSFQNVKMDLIHETELVQYLDGGYTKPDASLFEELLFGDKIYVITKILKSNKISIESYNSNEQEIEVKLPELNELLGSDITIQNENKRSTIIGKESRNPLVFGFRAVRLIYDRDSQQLKGMKDLPLKHPMRSTLMLSPLETSDTGFVDLQLK